MNPEWLTARLRVRRPLRSDEPAYLALFLKPAVGMRLRPPPLPAFTAPQVGAMLSEDIHHWDEHGFGPWALLDGESGSFLGRGGLQCTAVEGEPMVELPWVIEPDREGEGLATEAALAAIEWARSLALGEVVAIDNARKPRLQARGREGRTAAQRRGRARRHRAFPLSPVALGARDCVAQPRCSRRKPIRCQHRVHNVVEKAIANSFRRAQGALFLKPQPLGNCPTLVVLHRSADLDPIEPPDRQCVISESPYRLGHRSPALMFLGEPVPDARQAAGPINRSDSRPHRRCFPHRRWPTGIRCSLSTGLWSSE